MAETITTIICATLTINFLGLLVISFIFNKKNKK